MRRIRGALRKACALAVLAGSLAAWWAEAARPLRTEDAPLVPAATGEAEFGTAVNRAGSGPNGHDFLVALKIGLNDRADLGVEVPYAVGPEAGWGEAGVSLKFEAIRAGTLAAGMPWCLCFSSGLACHDYCLTLVTTKEVRRFAFHANAGAASTDGVGRVVLAGAAEAGVAGFLTLVGELLTCGGRWETQVGARVETPWRLVADAGVRLGRDGGEWTRQVQLGGTIPL